MKVTILAPHTNNQNKTGKVRTQPYQHFQSMRASDFVVVHKTSEEQIATYHALWLELHTQVETAEQFAKWVKRVPNWGCGCSSWLRDYVAKCPPPDTDLARYGFELHCAVNAKLGKTEFSWDEFCEKYPR
jgi:hypothetical protein